MRSRRPDTPLSALAERIASSAVVSCDVFDTAVMRQLARPEDVLLAAGARIVAAGHATVSAAAFREIRLAVEHVVRTQAHADGRDEVTLNAIYQHLACDRSCRRS